MGRRKIDIEFIREDRSRATTFIKRKSGLFKKAHELAILTGAQVAVVVFSQQDRLFTYSNEPCTDICTRFLENSEAYETKGPQDYAANQDNDDDSEEDNMPSNAAMKSANPSHSRTDSNVSTHAVPISPKGHSRNNSGAQASPDLAGSRRDSAASAKKQDRSRRSPPAAAGIASKRSASPSLHQTRTQSPKFSKHDHMSREVSDVRSSPHQPSRSRNGSITSTPPMVQAPEFAQMPLGPAPMHSSQQMFPQQAQMNPAPVYMQAQHNMHLMQKQYHDQNAISHQSQQQQQRIVKEEGQQRPDYSVPAYEPPTSTNRHLPMAPPLTIPSNAYSGQAPQQQPVQPLLPPGIGHSGTSRILLPGEGTGGTTGLTPVESPSNFASSLYNASGIAGIATNISMPRISTDVGSLFYNWNTNEPGLSPATSMMLNQFREGDGGNMANPSPGQTGNRGQASGPPISAGVLENFSPTTAQWLSGHVPAPSTANGRQ